MALRTDDLRTGVDCGEPVPSFTSAGPLHADEVGEGEGSLTGSDPPMKGKGLRAPCRSRCRGGEQNEEEDES